MRPFSFLACFTGAISENSSSGRHTLYLMGAGAAVWNVSYLLVSAAMLRRLLWHMAAYRLQYQRTKVLQKEQQQEEEQDGKRTLFKWLEYRIHGVWGDPVVGALCTSACSFVCSAPLTPQTESGIARHSVD